jgi:hypothetical protein
MIGDDDAPRSVLEILQQHGSMAVPPLRRGSTEALRKALRDPKGIRKWLKTHRKEATPNEEALIWRALFKLYGIPDGEYQWLAGRLAADLFPRCKALSKSHGGGPSKEFQAVRRELKQRLYENLETFCRDHPRLSWQHASALFMEKNKQACAAAGFRNAKAFAQAMKEISSATLP